MQNLIYRAALLARKDVIDAQTIHSVLDETPGNAVGGGDRDIGALIGNWLEQAAFEDGTLYQEALAELERPVFGYALARTNGNQLKAAQMLGINRNTLRKRLSELEIEPDKFSQR